MIKTDKKLKELIGLVKPITGVKKVKLSDFRHPCHIREDHVLVKNRILNLGLIK